MRLVGLWLLESSTRIARRRSSSSLFEMLIGRPQCSGSLMPTVLCMVRWLMTQLQLRRCNSAVRSAWELPDDPKDLAREELSATWDPVRELFGNERYDETNYVLANRIVNDRVMRNGKKASKRLIYIGATGWRNGNRDYDIEEARSKFGLDMSDEGLAAAIRLAMAATFGPHDSERRR